MVLSLFGVLLYAKMEVVSVKSYCRKRLKVIQRVGLIEYLNVHAIFVFFFQT